MKLLILSILLPLQVFAATNLETELEKLDMAKGQAPQSISDEKLYSVQDRALPLKGRTEVTIGAGHQLTGDGFLETNQVSIGAQYHINEKWSVAGSYSNLYNKFTNAADEINQKQRMLPNVVYTTERTELRGEYNLFYGKFRVSREQVYYFDQYVGLGMTQNTTENNVETQKVDGYVADAGLALWVPPYGAARLGFKNYTQPEKKQNKTVSSNATQFYLAYSYVF